MLAVGLMAAHMRRGSTLHELGAQCTRASAMQTASVVHLQPRLRFGAMSSGHKACAAMLVRARGGAAIGATERGWCIARASARAGGDASQRGAAWKCLKL